MELQDCNQTDDIENLEGRALREEGEMKRRQFLGSVAAAALFISMTAGIALAETPADTLVIAKVIDDAISFDPAESYEDTGTRYCGTSTRPLSATTRPTCPR